VQEMINERKARERGLTPNRVCCWIERVYNRRRHSALGYLTPAEYAARCRHTHHAVTCDIN
jgi:transposase InsO family protein